VSGNVSGICEHGHGHAPGGVCLVCESDRAMRSEALAIALAIADSRPLTDENGLDECWFCRSPLGDCDESDETEHDITCLYRRSCALKRADDAAKQRDAHGR
jgi:hypothetical protein